MCGHHLIMRFILAPEPCRDLSQVNSHLGHFLEPVLKFHLST
uniref:Uncharacterized protein n=1 Tax=Anguilla anguilla TaxID=7936 RepID=A0A0E9XP39_ANGAN